MRIFEMIATNLIKLTLVFVCFFVPVLIARACAISPFYQITSDPNRYAEKSTVIFLGEVVEIEVSTFSLQTVELKVLQVIKGSIDKKVRIINKLENNCSRTFADVNTRYYVFGNLENSGREIVMTGFPSFVPEKMAEQSGMLNKLTTSN